MVSTPRPRHPKPSLEQDVARLLRKVNTVVTERQWSDRLVDAIRFTVMGATDKMNRLTEMSQVLLVRLWNTHNPTQPVRSLHEWNTRHSDAEAVSAFLISSADTLDTP